MLVRKSSFPRDKIIRKIVYILIIFSVLPVVSSCTNKKIWGVPVSEFKLKLREGNYSFLQHIDYKEVDLREVDELDPNASFYFYYVFKKLGLESVSKKMLKLAYRRERGIWQQEAGLILLEGLIKGHDYNEALKVANSVLSNPNAEVMPYKDIVRLKRLKVEALYWLKRDEDVVKFIKLYNSGSKYGLNLSSDTELNLFLAVSSCRLKENNWKERFRNLYFDFYSSFVHSRGYAFLKKKEARFRAFDAFTLSVFSFKDLVGRGLKRDALPLGEEIIKKNPQKVSKETPLLVKELGFLYLSLGEYSRGIDFLGSVYPRLIGKARLNALEMVGRICRKAKRYGEAISYLKKVADNTLNGLQRDRVNWFIIDIYLNLSTNKALKYAEKTYTYWSDYLYFEDVLNSLVSKLVALKQWDKLRELYKAVRKNGPIDIKKRLLLILDIAIRNGSVTLDFKEQVGLNADIIDVVNNTPPDYYVLMLSGMENELLGSNGEVFSRLSRVNAGSLSSKGSSSDGNFGFFNFVNGFFKFGLNNEGYSYLMRNARLLSKDELLKIADLLNERGFFRQSINVVGLYLSRENRIKIDGKVKRLYYPTAYAEGIITNAKKYKIPQYVLFALVREESYFDPNIVSRAGAVGLTQLLPVTARDVSRKLRMKNPNLKDPITNIKLGAKHLSDLYKRLNDMTKALIAYNAGLSRVRMWEREFKGLNDILFIEALPFEETREYVKKIIFSSLHYSSLSPNNIIRYYFGETR